MGEGRNFRPLSTPAIPQVIGVPTTTAQRELRTEYRIAVYIHRREPPDNDTMPDSIDSWARAIGLLGTGCMFGELR